LSAQARVHLLQDQKKRSDEWLEQQETDPNGRQRSWQQSVCITKYISKTSFAMNFIPRTKPELESMLPQDPLNKEKRIIKVEIEREISILTPHLSQRCSRSSLRYFHAGRVAHCSLLVLRDHGGGCGEEQSHGGQLGH
jgi:hypothetical protein